jgi:hypothetical protein
VVGDRVIWFSSERHLHHSGGSLVGIRGISATRWIMVVTENNGAAVEVQV